jgi:hypothetical protein
MGERSGERQIISQLGGQEKTDSQGDQEVRRKPTHREIRRSGEDHLFPLIF